MGLEPCFCRNVIINSVHLPSPGQVFLSTCVSVEKLAPHPVTLDQRRKVGPNSADAVGRGRVGQGLRLSGKCSRYFLVHFDLGSPKITLEATPNRGLRRLHIPHVKQLGFACR